MKILYIITQADGGGAQKYVLALAGHFSGDIACGDEKTSLFDEAGKLGIKTHKLKHLKRDISPWHDFLAMLEIRQLIQLVRPDIVHLNSTKAGILGSFAAIGLKPKVVFTAHGFRFNEPLPYSARQFYLALEKVASSYRDFIIAVSDVDKQSALKNKLISADKIATIHNGIKKIEFLPKEEARKALELPLDKKIIGVIANDYKTKGLDILEKIGFITDTLICVIGKIDPRKKSNNYIKYLGYKENASKYLKAFDIFAIPSRKEGFPYVALEAMQAGLPIVATAVGGIPEALGDAGILVPPENPNALARAIETVAGDAAKRDQLSQKTLERSKLFTEEKMLGETKKNYEKLLQK